jgi:hypothetical protein
MRRLGGRDARERDARAVARDSAID